MRGLISWAVNDALTLEKSALETLYRIEINNSGNKTKLSCNTPPHWRSTPPSADAAPPSLTQHPPPHWRSTPFHWRSTPLPPKKTFQLSNTRPRPSQFSSQSGLNKIPPRERKQCTNNSLTCGKEDTMQWRKLFYIAFESKNELHMLL